MLLYLAIPCPAQIYKYIGVEDGLSNRRVYAIKKDAEGYMWFLTHDGIDRYDGYKFKRYKLKDGEEEISSMMNLNWLYNRYGRESMGHRTERKGILLRPVSGPFQAGVQAAR